MESASCCGMESAQGAGWNHGNAVYGIKPQELYSLRASRNAMRDCVGVPYNARGALIPYQACGLDKFEPYSLRATPLCGGTSCNVAPVAQRSRSNFARLAGKRAFRLGFAALSAPRAPSACGGAQVSKSFHLRQKEKNGTPERVFRFFGGEERI